MTTEENVESKNESQQRSGFAGGKILAGALYIATTIFVLGFLWQSIASFLSAE